jgi:hypothetical protein
MPGLLGDSLLGFSGRGAYPSETRFFSENPSVAGFASEDNRIVLNPYSGLSEAERKAVAQNEAVRLWLRTRGITPLFGLTGEQSAFFSGTPYGDPQNAQPARDSIMARMLSGDPSSGVASDEQQAWAQWMLRQLQSEGLLR